MLMHLDADGFPQTDHDETVVSFDGSLLEIISQSLACKVRLAFRKNYSPSAVSETEIDALNPVLSELASELLNLYAEAESKE
jgi:hypothetical protein